jgi:hypothetical protein
MEVALVSDQCVRIKTKKAQFLTPVGGKFEKEEDVVLRFEKTRQEGSLHVFDGPGEYEVSGVKLTGLGKTEVTGYLSKIEGMDVVICRSSSITRLKDQVSDVQICIIDAHTPLGTADVANLNPKIVVVFGEHAAAYAHTISTEITPTAKVSLTKDKISDELQVILLG